MKQGFIILLSLFFSVSGFCQDTLCTPANLKKASVTFENGVYWAIGEDSLYSLVSSQGEVLTKMKYAKAYPFYNGIATVERNKSLGLVNTSGKEIGRCMFQLAPEKFGVTQFKFGTDSDMVSWMYVPYMHGVWLNRSGKMLLTGTKVAFTIEDVISDKLWDY